MHASLRYSRALVRGSSLAVTMITVLLLAALPLATVFALDTGFFSPSYFTMNGRTAWTNPSFSFATDDQYASTSGKAKQLTLSNFNVDPIQGNSQINGIVVTVEGHTEGRQVSVALSGDAGTTWSTSQTTALPIGTTDAVRTLGGPTIKWGGTWTADSFTNANLRVRLTSASTNNGFVYVDHVQIKIYFTPPNATLTVDPISVSYGVSTVDLSATLTETGAGPLQGKTVTFTFNGVPLAPSVTTDINGLATYPDVSIAGLAAGTYEVRADFAGDGFYQATYGLADLTIVGIPLTVTADPQTKHYGYPEPTLTYQVVGTLLPGASWTGNLLRDPGETIGDYYINQGTLTAGPGYTITYVGDFLTIDQAPLTVTADNQDKLTSDPPITNFSFQYSGFVLGQGPGALTTEPTCSVPAGTDQSVAGNYPITCSGGVADNYSFIYVAGTLRVNAVPTDITLSRTFISENRKSGAVVGTLTSTDPVDTVFNYTLQNDHPDTCNGVDNAAFTIDNATATLKTAVLFNYEAKKTYTICIQTDDLHGGTFQKQFSIAVTDLPETFRSVAGYDGFILESGETTGKGGTMDYKSIIFRLGDNAGDQQYRAILSFPTGLVPDQAVITKLTLKIKRAGLPVGTNPFLTHGRILLDNKKGYFGTTRNLELIDFQALPTKAEWLRISNAPVSSWYSTTLIGPNILLINRLGPTQLRLRFQLEDNDDRSADYLNFYSGNAALANQPVLELQYYIP